LARIEKSVCPCRQQHVRAVNSIDNDFLEEKKKNHLSSIYGLMARFVAFLKGINVGGRIVTKGELQSMIEDLGFKDVVTYRQSGNVILEAGTVSSDEARVKIGSAVRKRLGYDVPIFIRTFGDLKRILDSAPKHQSKAGSSLLVTLLPGPFAKFPSPLPMTIPNSTAQIISARGAEVFSETHGDGEGALPNPLVESKLGVKATTRNLNVIRDIVDKFG
jgi:uncharacterized protein (DUF1697 family)